MLHSILGRTEEELTSNEAEYVWSFTRPYVCVIHEPTGRGFYLDRNYRHVVSVDNIPRPGTPGLPETLKRCVEHETERHHLCASFTLPAWIEGLSSNEFTTYWLY
jgi:hypothetical protein